MVRRYCTRVCRPGRGDGGVWERPGVQRKERKDVMVTWKMRRKRARVKWLQRSKANTFPQNCFLKVQTDRQKLCYFSDQNLTNRVGQLFVFKLFNTFSQKVRGMRQSWCSNVFWEGCSTDSWWRQCYSMIQYAGSYCSLSTTAPPREHPSQCATLFTAACPAHICSWDPSCLEDHNHDQSTPQKITLGATEVHSHAAKTEGELH